MATMKISVSLLLSLLLGLASASTNAQNQPQLNLPRTTLSIGFHQLQVQVAATPEQQATGLMFRTDMPAHEGMLFVFPQDERHCMWMKNTFVPLSVAFIDDKGRIVSIHDMEPQTENSHCAATNARYALEMAKGWFRGKGISAGALVGGIDKAPSPR